jgi:hypothetical protein
VTLLDAFGQQMQTTFLTVQGFFLVSSHNRSPPLSFHIHYFPKITTFSLVLCPGIANPPIPISLTVTPVLHVCSEYRWNTAFTKGNAWWAEVRSIETKCDIDAAI